MPGTTPRQADHLSILFSSGPADRDWEPTIDESGALLIRAEEKRQRLAKWMDSTAFNAFLTFIDTQILLGLFDRLGEHELNMTYREMQTLSVYAAWSSRSDKPSVIRPRARRMILVVAIARLVPGVLKRCDAKRTGGYPIPTFGKRQILSPPNEVATAANV